MTIPITVDRIWAVGRVLYEARIRHCWKGVGAEDRLTSNPWPDQKRYGFREMPRPEVDIALAQARAVINSEVRPMGADQSNAPLIGTAAGEKVTDASEGAPLADTSSLREPSLEVQRIKRFRHHHGTGEMGG